MRRDSSVTAQGVEGKGIGARRLSLGVLKLVLLCWSFSVTHLSRRAVGAVSPSSPSPGTLVDVAPFGSLLPAGNGIAWDDPREIQRVVVRFRGRAPSPERVILQYMESAWPEQRWP